MSSLPSAASQPSPPTLTEARTPSALALLVMLSGTFMVVLDFFIVAVALPSIQHELHASDGALQWVVIGYGLATGIALITGGRLGDIHGKRRVFMVGLALFCAASLVCGLAPSAAVLVGARLAQGLAGAILQPQVTAMLNLLYTGQKRAKAFAAYGLTLGMAAACGQLIGGLLIHADLAGLGWRSCFLINLPIGLAALALCPRVLPALEGRAGSRLDLVGAALLAAALTLVVLPLVQGRDAGWPLWTLACLVAAPVMAAVFWWQQRTLAARGGQPLVSPSLLAQPAFALGLLVVLNFHAGNASFYFALALYLQQGMNLPPLDSGLVFTAMAVMFFLTSMAAPKLAQWLGSNAIVAGAVLVALGYAALFTLVMRPAQPTVAMMVAVLLVQGVGLGMVMAPMVAAVLAGLPAQHAGVASGVVATVQHVGNALGVALIGMLFYAPQMESAARSTSVGFGYGVAYLGTLAVCLALLYRSFACRAATRAAP